MTVLLRETWFIRESFIILGIFFNLQVVLRCLSCFYNKNLIFLLSVIFFCKNSVCNPNRATVFLLHDTLHSFCFTSNGLTSLFIPSVAYKPLPGSRLFVYETMKMQKKAKAPASYGGPINK